MQSWVNSVLKEGRPAVPCLEVEVQEQPGGVRNTGLFETPGFDKLLTLAMDGGYCKG